MGALDNLEQVIRSLAEEPFVRILGNRVLPQRVMRALATAIEDSEYRDVPGRPQTPLRYVIELNPTDLDYLKQEYPDLERQFEAALARVAARWHSHGMPTVVLESDERVSPHDVRIRLTANVEALAESTRELKPVPQLDTDAPEDSCDPARAYLVIEGGRIFDLTKPRTYIGRALDNDLILDAPQVSRHHAVLERRFGRYVLRDLESTRGSWVNGFRVAEAVLQSGDVILLAGVEILYVESALRQHSGQGQTQPVPRVVED